VKRYLLDTGIAGDFINRRHGVFERAREEVATGNKIGIGIPVLGELWYGVENSATRERNVTLLRRTLPNWKIWPFTEAAAEEFGRLLAELQRLGRPIGRIDVQIAAIALTLGNTTVVSKDSDLSAVPGLKVENWATGAS
jgi:tRNA(fMet)-specific endonuclease VapC